MSGESLVRVRERYAADCRFVARLGVGPPTGERVVAVDRFSAWLALVNWCVLLLLFSVLLLATSLPTNSLLTGGSIAADCASVASSCPTPER